VKLCLHFWAMVVHYGGPEDEDGGKTSPPCYGVITQE